MASEAPIISAKNLFFTYNKGKDNEFQALVDISLDVFRREFIIFFGPSGCGKSTLLNIFAGLETPDSGNVLAFGKELTRMTPREQAEYHRRQVGMVYQQYNLITSLSVLDNVALPQIFINVRKGKRDDWGRKLLDRMGILAQAKKIPTELSGGQQQRIGIARSIVNNPEIVLADEPVGNLDSVSAKNVLDIMAELNEKEGKTIIMVTHNPENLVYGDRIIYMKDGIITREVVNKDKKRQDDKKSDGPGGPEEMIPKTTVNEINDLMRAYHGLSPEQINILIMPYKAKAFAHHFISSRNMEETKIMEDLIQRRLLGTISKEDFADHLHQSSLGGGVGFDIRTTNKIKERVDKIIEMARFVYQDDEERKVSDKEKAEGLTEYILETCYQEHRHNLNDTQFRRLVGAVQDRLTAVVQKDGFFKFLDLPFKDGGVGLNTKTVRSMTEELELILILGFGIVQRKEQDKKEAGAGQADSATATGLSAQIADKISRNISEQQGSGDPASGEAKEQQGGFDPEGAGGQANNNSENNVAKIDQNAENKE